MAKYQDFLSRVGSNRDRAALRGIFSMFLTDDNPPKLKDLTLASIILSGAETTQITVSGASTTGFLQSGTSTTAYSITGAFTTGISIAADGTTGIAITSAFSGVNMISLAGTGSTSGILISGACGIGLSITGACTDGIKLATGAMTDGIEIASACTNGINISGVCTADIKLQSGSTITDSNHLSLQTLSDTKAITLNSRNYAVTSGDIIGFQAKPAANATGTCTVYGGQISPRANDNVDIAALIGLQVEPILKGATVLAVSGDMRGLDVRLTSEGANTVGGKAGCYFAYNLLKSATFTGGVYPFVVTASGDTQAWTALMEIPTGLSGVTVGAGALVYIPITIDGVAARLVANYVS